MRTPTAVLLLVLATALSACGDSSENAEPTSPTPTATPDPTAKAAESLASVLTNNSTGAVGFTSGQADCVAKGFVDQFGVDGLQEMGLLTEELDPGNPSGGFALSPVEASGAADATLACVNASDFITNLMNNGGPGGLDDATVNCVADNLGDTGTHDLLVAAFEGDQKAIQDVLLPAAFACTTG